MTGGGVVGGTLGGGAVGGGRNIRVIEQFSLDARRRLVLVEVEGRRILVAVAPQQVTALTEWARKESDGEQKATA